MINVKFIIFSALVILVSINLVSAITEVTIDGTSSISTKQIFKQGELTDFKIQCFNNITSDFCAIATVNCNITVIYPNSSIFINNQPMTNQFSFNNYTLNLQKLGDYSCSAICCTKDICGHNQFYFVVTPNGEESTIAGAILYMGLIAVFVLFIIFLFYMFGKAESLIAKVSCLSGIYVLAMGTFFVAWQLANGFITSNSFLVEFLRILFFVAMIGFFPFIIILFAWGVYMMITIKEITSMMDRGIGFEEATERSKWKK